MSAIRDTLTLIGMIVASGAAWLAFCWLVLRYGYGGSWNDR